MQNGVLGAKTLASDEVSCWGVRASGVHRCQVSRDSHILSHPFLIVSSSDVLYHISSHAQGSSNFMCAEHLEVLPEGWLHMLPINALFHATT
jgi:hypothetical protein